MKKFVVFVGIGAGLKRYEATGESIFDVLELTRTAYPKTSELMCFEVVE